MNTLESTLTERGKAYGDFIDNATLAQHLKHAIHNTPNWEKLDMDQAEALEIILSKISRMMTGNHLHRDNWHDIAGYATLVDERMAEKETNGAGS